MNISKKAKKHLGQNFLISEPIKNRIIEAGNIQPDDVILEIGPGMGAMTRKIIEQGAAVYAVEKDPDMIRVLKENLSGDRLHVVSGDILKQKLADFPALTKIIGNIPYNISTPVIEWLIQERARCPEVFLTVQWEFARRLAAKPHNKDYGALSCFAQYYAQIDLLFKISPKAFRPIPKVTSCLIHLVFRKPAIKAEDEGLLFRITQTSFQQRRKKIINALERLFEKEMLIRKMTALGISPESRAENITLEQYVELANALTRQAF